MFVSTNKYCQQYFLFMMDLIECHGQVSTNIQTSRKKKKKFTLICDKRCHNFHIIENVSSDPRIGYSVSAPYRQIVFFFLDFFPKPVRVKKVLWQGAGRVVIFFRLPIKRKSALFNLIFVKCLLMCHELQHMVGEFKYLDFLFQK